MRIKILLFIALFSTFGGFAQQVTPVIDVGAIEADIAYHKMQYTFIEEMKNKETSIAALQESIKEQTAKIEEIERKLYSSLKDVDRTIQQGKALIRAGKTIQRIYCYIHEIDSIVIGDPKLIIIANQTKLAMLKRCTSLAEYLDLSLLGGNINLMSTVERSRLINHVNWELSTISGMCYSIKKQILAAKRNGIMQAIMKEYFSTIYRYHRKNAALVDKIVSEANFHF